MVISYVHECYCRFFYRMPLLWKKRSHKVTVAPPVTNTRVIDNNLTPSVIHKGAGKNESSTNNNATFVFILKDFNVTLSDELPVLRGQIVQPLYNDGIWLYVKNVDGKCGFIPSEYTCSINDIKDRWHSEKDRNECKKTKIVTEKLHQAKPISSSTLPCNTNTGITHSCETNGGASISQHSSNSPITPQVIKKRLSESSGIIELSSSPRNISNALPRLHPLHPLSLTHNSSTYSKSKADTESTVSSSTPVTQPLSVHFRTQSYQEAVICAEEDPGGHSVGIVPVRLHPSRPSNLPLHFMHHSNNCFPETFTTATSVGLQTNTQDSHLDDVFLPLLSKPVGIYKTMKRYDKTAPGEVSLQENEYLIVTELGCGEWASVITALGAEGIIPKSILVRYIPNIGGVASLGTQTELIITGPSTTISVSSSRTQCESRAVSQFRGPNSLQRRTAEIAIQTDCVCSPLVMDAWISPSQTVDDLWYENSMSIPQLTGLGLNCDSPSICTLPTMNGLNQEYGVAPLAFHSSRQSLPQFSAIHPVPCTLPTPLEERRKLPCSPALPTNETNAKTQVVVLTATKNFVPDIQERSCYLTLKKGDILHVDPVSNTVSGRGWIWVYHLNKNTYGFVPKSHTEFIYLAANHCGVTRYDEV